MMLAMLRRVLGIVDSLQKMRAIAAFTKNVAIADLRNVAKA